MTTSHVADTTPYGWPWDGRIRGPSLALVVCGWSPAWRALADHDAATVDDRVVLLRDAVAAIGGLVVVTAAPPPPVPRPAVATGAPAPPGVAADAVIDTPGLDAFYGSPLDATLRRAERTHLLLAGHGLEGPLHSTMRSANDRGYECLLVADAASAGDETLRASAVSQIEMSGGIFGAVGSSDHVLTALSHAEEQP